MHRLFGKAKPQVAGPSLGDRLICSFDTVSLFHKTWFCLSLITFIFQEVVLSESSIVSRLFFCFSRLYDSCWCYSADCMTLVDAIHLIVKMLFAGSIINPVWACPWLTITYTAGDASASINNRVAAIDEKIKGDMNAIKFCELSTNDGFDYVPQFS